jgi:antitoxin VapB
VTEAIRERLARIREERDGFEDDILQIGRECAERLKEPYRSVDHGELLYGDSSRRASTAGRGE